MDKLNPWEPSGSSRGRTPGLLGPPCDQGVSPEWCGLGLVYAVTNGTPESNCNTASMVGPPNHYGWPASITFQVPEGVIFGALAQRE